MQRILCSDCLVEGSIMSRESEPRYSDSRTSNGLYEYDATSLETKV